MSRSKVYDTVCIYCLDPNSYCLASDTEEFGPIECQQLLMDVFS